MPIIVPDGLGRLIDFGMKHAHIISAIRPWYTTYQGASIVDVTPAQAKSTIEQLMNPEMHVHGNVIKLLGGWARRHFAKTVEPLGDTIVYNPSNHVTWPGLGLGAIVFVDEQMLKHDKVVDAIRGCEFGNPGHIEIRGALSEDSVDSSFDGETPVNSAFWPSRIADWFEFTMNAFVGNDMVWVIAGEPQDGPPVRSTVDNQHRTVKNYGETIIRAVSEASFGGIRTDKGFSKFFNKQG